MGNYPDATCVAVRDQLLFDVFVAAVPAGISRWAHGYFRAVDKYTFSAYLVDYDLNDHRVDRTTMVRGMGIAACHPEIAWSTGVPPTVFEPFAEWVFDERDADYVVQLGLYSNLRYSTEDLLNRGIIQHS